MLQKPCAHSVSGNSLGCGLLISIENLQLYGQQKCAFFFLSLANPLNKEEPQIFIFYLFLGNSLLHSLFILCLSFCSSITKDCGSD